MQRSSRRHCFARQTDRTKSVQVPCDQIPNLLQAAIPIWADIEAPTLDDISWLKQVFDFHDLALEDILNDEVRPKQELYDDVLFTVFGAINLDADENELSIVNLNIFLTENLIVTVHSKPIKTVRKAIQIVKARQGVLTRGIDHLYYLLLDGLIDRYFDVLDEIEEDIEEIEDHVFNSSNGDIQEKIFESRRKITYLKRSISPKREALKTLVTSEFPQINEDTRIHLRDVLDHVLRIDDMLESYRELLNGLMSSYITQLSNQMNEVMKLMSIIATIMLPLSFLTGLFGMNFDKIPGLHSDMGFWVLISLMTILIIAMIGFFKYKKIL